MIRRALTAVVLVATVAMPSVPAYAAAAKAPRPAPVAQQEHDRPEADDPAGHRADRAAKAGTKGHRAFVYSGRITGVDAAAGTVSLRVTGGTERAARHTTLTVTVAASARVRRDGVPSTTAALVVGDRVTVKGTRAAGVLTVQRVTASGDA